MMGLSGMVYNGETYYYEKNTLGDIVGIRNSSGTQVATYYYDAWGNIIAKSGSMADINPFRYRGYYYDNETGFYYLQTRYYDPTICRFINADNYELLGTLSQTIGQLNLYAYANNNPIMYTDESGELVLTTFGIWAIIGIVTASIVLGGGAQLVSNIHAGEKGSDLWRGVAGSALGAGANALALCLSPFTGGASLAFAAGIGAAVQTGVDTIEKLILGEDVTAEETVSSLGLNFVTTFAGNFIGSELIPINAGWFKPQKFLSVFTKPYGQKILMQSLIGSGLSGTLNFAIRFHVEKFYS